MSEVNGTNEDIEEKEISAKVGIKINAMIQALEKTLGNVTESAKLVGMDRDNHYIWLKKYPKYKEAFERINEMNIDFVESKMFERINGYEHKETKVFLYRGQVVTKDLTKHYPPDTALIKFYLETKGKSRGYVPRNEIVNKDENPFEGMTEEEIDAELEKLRKDERKRG